MSQNQTRLFSSIIFGSLLGLIACQQKSTSPKQPATANPSTGVGIYGTGVGTGVGYDPYAGTNTGTIGTVTNLSITPLNQTQLIAPIGQRVRVDFQLNGTETRTAGVGVGLAELPPGSRLLQSGNSVTFCWDTPTAGSYNIRFILRDMGLCQTTESANPSVCTINPADYGRLYAKSYDVTSDAFLLQVGNGTGINNGLTNGNLIAQIIGLIGGNSGASLQNILSSLTNGQLTNIFTTLQNGGTYNNPYGTGTGVYNTTGQCG